MAAVVPSVARLRVKKALSRTCSWGLAALLIHGNGVGAGTCTLLSGQDDLDNARSLAQKEYDAHPSDPQCQLAFALLMRNADSARGLYKKIIALETAPDSLKAEAFYRLACMSYMAANYVKAQTYGAGACSLDNRDVYRRLLSRSAALAGRDSSERLLKIRKTDSTRAIADTGKNVASLPEKIEKKPAATAFYLQVAAFAEFENAQSLRKDLLRLFPRVVVKEGSSRGKNIFRVRIGPFAGEKEAQAYGDSALQKNKISFRMVED